MIEQLAVLAILFIVLRVTRHSGQRIDLGRFVEYSSKQPNAYRLWDQALIYLEGRPFSLITVYSLSWVACIGITYLLLMPTAAALLIFIAGVLAVSVNFSVRASLMYPMLALLVITGHPIFLLPLGIIKDHALWIGIGAILLTNGLSLLFVVCAGVALLLYLGVRVKIKAEWSDGGAPQFTARFVFNLLLGKNPEFSRGVIFWNLAGVAIMTFYGLLMNWPLLVWGAAPIFLFGCFWEPQLWLPIMIVLMGVG